MNAGAKIVDDEVLGISFDGKYNVSAKGGDYSADAVIIATGTSRTTPRIKGIRELEGRGGTVPHVTPSFSEARMLRSWVTANMLCTKHWSFNQ